MPSLNVVALISGGKDSFYSILHCIQNGHTVVALANLHPETASETSDGHGEAEDLNSFMYQTVGHSVIPLYASALNLTLYRRSISGTATQTGSYYAYAPAGPLDETEDLFLLLQEVMQNHTQVNAMCSGAILSTYQRTRIESVAVRLSLTPLAFLWQYPALPPPVEREDSITGLLDDMEAAACDSRIIKTASGGVRDTMLWANVASLKTRNELVAAMSPFFQGDEFWLRGSVLGEGGEYETLAINGPPRVWKRRIVIEENDNTAIRDEGGASHLKLGRAELIEQEQTEDDHRSTLVRIPGLFDPAFTLLQGKISSASSSSSLSISSTVESTEAPRDSPLQGAVFQVLESPYLGMSMTSTRTSIAISNMTTTECSGTSYGTIHVMNLLQTCIHSLNRERPSSAQLSVDDIVFTLLLLDSMIEFTAVNTVYGRAFTAPNPPARVTIACGDRLPENVHFSLSVVLDTGSRMKRKGLHVQSRSYWAPANIGPYSQAVSVPITSRGEARNGDDGEIVHVAGQIPLVPHTMEIMEGTFLEQSTLALQHLWRVGQERSVDLWTHGVAYLAKPSDSTDVDPERLQIVWRIWEGAHAWSQRPKDVEEDEDEYDGPDAWDLKHNPYHHRGLAGPNTSARKPSGTHLHPLPRLSVMQNGRPATATVGNTFTPPLLIAEVDSLPRAAPIEWHSLGLGGMPTTKPRIHLSTVETGPVSASRFTVLANADEQGADEPESAANTLDPETRDSTDTAFVTVQVRGPEERPRPGDASSAIWSTPSITSTMSDIVNTDEWTIAQGTAYVAGTSGWSILRSLQETATGWGGLFVIPCRAVWGADASEAGEHVTRLDLGLVLRLERC